MSESVVSLIVRKGNPKGIHTWDDLLKPGIKVLTPNPFTSGAAKWNILAAYGAKSGGGEDPQKGLAYLRELITKHVTVQDKSRPRGAAGLHVGQRRRPHLLRERGDHGPEEGPAGRLRHPGPDDPDREPDRRRLEVQAPRAGQGVPRLRALAAAQQKFADWGYRPVDEAVLDKNKAKFPDAQRPVHHPRPRRLEQGQRRVLRSRQGLGRRDREGRGGLHCQVRHSPRVTARRSPRARPDPPSPHERARAGRRDAVAERHRAHPARGARRARRPTAASTPSGRRSRAVRRWRR